MGVAGYRKVPKLQKSLIICHRGVSIYNYCIVIYMKQYYIIVSSEHDTSVFLYIFQTNYHSDRLSTN